MPTLLNSARIPAYRTPFTRLADRQLSLASPQQGGEIPPPNRTAFYGLNAVCAVWQHVPATGTTHFGSIGNQYAIYPR